MKKYKAEIKIMPLKNLLDPQGKAVSSNMKNIGLPQISEIRIGKHIELNVLAKNKEEAHKIVKTSCDKILANKIMEYFEIEIQG